MSTPGWGETFDGENKAVTITDGITIVITAIDALPDEPDVWAASLLNTASFAVTDLVTDDGWPTMCFEHVDAASASMVFLYRFLEYGAISTVHAAPETYAEHRAEILRWLATGTIEWDHQPLTLEEIWSGLPGDR